MKAKKEKAIKKDKKKEKEKKSPFSSVYLQLMEKFSNKHVLARALDEEDKTITLADFEDEVDSWPPKLVAAPCGAIGKDEEIPYNCGAISSRLPKPPEKLIPMMEQDESKGPRV